MKIEFVVESAAAPVVEIDTAARAAYIRFKRAKVVRTVSPDTCGPIVAVDLDRGTKVIGVELIGVREFSLTVLLKKLPFMHVNAPIERARYMPTRAVRHEPKLEVV